MKVCFSNASTIGEEMSVKFGSLAEKVGQPGRGRYILNGSAKEVLPCFLIQTYLETSLRMYKRGFMQSKSLNKNTKL